MDSIETLGLSPNIWLRCQSQIKMWAKVQYLDCFGPMWILPATWQGTFPASARLKVKTMKSLSNQNVSHSTWWFVQENYKWQHHYAGSQIIRKLGLSKLDFTKKCFTKQCFGTSLEVQSLEKRGKRWQAGHLNWIQQNRFFVSCKSTF